MFTELLSSIRWNSHPCWKCYLNDSRGSSTFPVSDRYLFLVESSIHTRGMCWQSLAGFRGSLRKVQKKLLPENVRETSPFSQMCACAWPWTHRCVLWTSPAALTHKMYFRANCCKLLLECDGCHLVRKHKYPLMHVLMYSGRILNGSTRVTQHLAALSFERRWVFIFFVSRLNFLWIFFF